MLEKLKQILKQNSFEFKVSLIVFASAILLGAVSFPFIFTSPEKFQNLINTTYGDVLDLKNHLTFTNVFLSIYQRNITAAAITILLGLVFRYLPQIIIFFNGLLIGVVAVGMAGFGLSLITFLQLITPHGIFEIPALLLSASIGMRLSRIAQPNSFKNRVKSLIGSKYYILTVLILLLIAGIIESYSIVQNAK